MPLAPWSSWAQLAPISAMPIGTTAARMLLGLHMVKLLLGWCG
jgi:hypothetical protein